MSADSQKKLKPGDNRLDRALRWVLAFAVVALLIILLYPKLILPAPQYRLGDIAPKNIKADRNFFFEDREATEINRRQTAAQVLTVYDYDPRIGRRIVKKVETAFSEMRQELGNDNETKRTPTGGEALPLPPTADNKTLENERVLALWAHKDKFQSILGIEINRGAYQLLINEGFSENIVSLISKIINDIMATGVVGNKEVLLNEADRGIVLRDVFHQTEKTVYGLRQYYGPDQAKTMVRIVGEPLVKDLNYNLINMIVDVAQRLIQPNITFNRHETEERIKTALAGLKPVMYQIKAGEMLLREGERITQAQLLKLQALEEHTESQQILTAGLGMAIMMAAFLIALHRLFFHQARFAPLDTNRNMIFMGITLILVLLIVKLTASFSSSAFSIPSSAVILASPTAGWVMLVCLFLEFDVALLFSLVAALCATLLGSGGAELFFFFFTTNAMAAYWVRDCRERKQIVLAGTKVGVLGTLMALAGIVYTSQPGIIVMVWHCAMAFLGGIASGVIAVGIAPLAEMAFGYTNAISLLELANLDRPILRRLMLAAPGTYHHSVIVGTMVEAAAAQIGANPLLAKVCGYYHDIGKVKKPLYFIENQKGGVNRHDKLAPSMSSLILIAHIKDGVEIARQNKLGQTIIDTIQQHHGTSLIHYFYEKAKKLKGESHVKIEDFRYPGPRPQTKEAGLVMLADVVEAASRTLENPTPARIQGLVQNLINKIFSDGQLDNCELTLKDLHSIAKSFNTILYGIHHHRIEYGESATRETGKVKNGSSDRQPAEKLSHRDQGGPKDSSGHLKRLGMS